MKIAIFFIVSLLVIAGCGSLEPPVIKTEGNIYSSTNNPTIQIDLPVEFKYLGSSNRFVEIRRISGSETTLMAEKDTHIYVDLTNDNYLKGLVRINLLELSSGKRWHPETIRTKNPLKRGVLKKDSRNFQYSIKATRTTGRFTSQFLLDKGITTPTCNLWLLYGKVLYRNVKIYLSYYEDISNFKEFGIDSCKGWSEKEELNGKQMEYLEEFEKRAHNNIKIN